MPGSTRLWSSGSPTASDTATLTWTRRAASVSSGRSRRSNVPLVKIENDVPESASAAMIPGINA